MTLAAWAVATLLGLGYAQLYCRNLDRPGVFGDETNFAVQGFDLSIGATPRGDWSSALMMCPYAGSLKSWIYFCLYQSRPPSVRLMRSVAVATGAVFLAACAALAGTFFGPLGALCAGLLIMADPAVFVNIRHDYTGAGTALTFFALGAIALTRWHKSRAPVTAGFGGLCFGLSVWLHLLCLVPIAAAVAAMTLSRPRFLREEIAAAGWGRLFFLAGAAAGLLPVLLYFGCGDRSEHYAGLIGAARAYAWVSPTLPPYFGRSGFRLSGPLEHAALLLGYLAGPDEAYSRLLGGGAPGPGTLVLGSWLAAAALAFVGRKGKGFFLAMPLLSACLLCCVPSFHGLHHVVIALYPWLYLAMTELFCEAWTHALPRWRRALGAVPAILCFAASLRATCWLRGEIEQDAVDPRLSFQVQTDLSKFMEGRREAITPIMSLVSGVQVMTNGRKREDNSLTMVFGDTSILEQPGVAAWVAGKLRNPNALYLLQSGDGSVLCLRAKRLFFERARDLGLSPVVVHRIVSQRSQAPIFDLVRLVPAADTAAMGAH